jgi:carboxymethylenebutenolidase
MCYSTDARPPDHGLGGQIRSSADLLLTAADGNRLMARAAHPAQPGGAGVVILPDVRGLHNFYKDLCCRFAEAGIDAVAFDYFGRTAGIGERTDEFDYKVHTVQTTFGGVAMDVAAALAHLRTGGATRLFTIGFCFGGSRSWRQAAEQPGLDGAIGFYGRPQLAEDVFDDISAPILMLVAGADASTPHEEFQAMDRRLSERGLPHRMVVYEGAPHSFFDRAAIRWADACADSWRQILSFIKDPTAEGLAA